MPSTDPGLAWIEWNELEWNESAKCKGMVITKATAFEAETLLILAKYTLHWSQLWLYLGIMIQDTKFTG